MGGPANRTPVPTDRLAIGFHLRLLEVGRNSMQGLSIGQHHPTRHPERIDIPDFNQRHVQRHVGLRVRGLEVAVHGPGPVEQCTEGLAARPQRNGESHRAPQGEPPSDPVSETEDPVFLDAHASRPLHVGRHGREVGPSLFSQLLPEPGHRSLGIGHGLLRRERLGDDDDQRRTGFATLQSLIQVEWIHIAHESNIERSALLGPQRSERFMHHHWPEVGPPDSDVDDMGEATAGYGGVLALPDLIREVESGLPRRQHVVHHGLAVHGKGVFRSAAQGHVQHGAALSLVDRLAAELSVPGSLPIGRLSQLAKAIPGRPIDQLLGEVEPPPESIGGQDPSVHSA